MNTDDFIISRPLSSVNPILSSLAGALKEYILGNFPKNYIKDYYIDTELPYIRALRTYKPLSRSQIAMRKLPLLSVRTEVTVESSEFSLNDSWEKGNRFLRKPSSLNAIIKDDYNFRYLSFQTERIVVKFQVSIVVETDTKAREVLMFIKRVLPINRKTFLNGLHINSELPPEIIRHIWKDSGFTFNQSDITPENLDEFQYYLKAVSAGNIESCINSSTGNTSYSFFYSKNAVMSIDAINMNVNKDGNVVKNASVDIPITLDLEVPIAYVYQKDGSFDDIHNIDIPNDFSVGENMNRPYFSFAKRERAPTTIENNLGLTFMTGIVTGDLENKIYDETDLSLQVAPDVKTYLASLGNEKKKYILWLEGNMIDSSQFIFNESDYILKIKTTDIRFNYKYYFSIYSDLHDYDITNKYNNRVKPASPFIKK